MVNVITGMVVSITDVLNTWADLGVFSYVIPFLLIFAVVYAILEKTKILGSDNKGVLVIISAAVGLLALQFDLVSTFYATIFPRFGVGLSIFLVLIILVGFFMPNSDPTKMAWIGWVVGIGVVLWALTNWNFWTDNFSLGMWLGDYFWPIIILTGVILAIAAVSGGFKKKGP
ncbi:MAG: hypothetical protein WCP89_03600 [archaeon]